MGFRDATGDIIACENCTRYGCTHCGYAFEKRCGPRGRPAYRTRRFGGPEDHKLSLEYRDVALRAHRIAAARTTQADVLEFIESIEAVAEPTVVTWQPRPLRVVGLFAIESEE